MRVRHARTVLISVVTFAASVMMTVAGPASAQAATGSRPLPVDPHGAGVSGHASARAALPDQRRSPGLKALLSEKDADRAGDDPSLSALCQDGIGTPNPYRNPSPNVDQIVGDTIVDCRIADRMQFGAEREHDRGQSGESKKSGGRYQRLSGLQQSGATQRLIGVGLHHVRRRQVVDQCAIATSDFPDRRNRGVRPDGFRRRSGTGLRPAQHGVLRQHRVQPRRCRPGRAPRPPTGSP